MSNFYGADDDFEEGRGRSYAMAALLFVVVGIIGFVWWINNSGAGGAPPQPATAAPVDARTFTSPAITDKQFEQRTREARFKAGQTPLLTPEQQKAFNDAQNKTAPTP